MTVRYTISSRSRALRRLAVAASVVALLAACEGRFASRGFVPDEDTIASIQPGAATKLDVEDTLGTPSTVGTFQQNVWYYIHERTQQKAFFDPEVLERKIVVVSFDDQDVVSDIRVYTKDDAKNVELVERETPTAGNELGFFEQLFGNLGRFNEEV